MRSPSSSPACAAAAGLSDITRTPSPACASSARRRPTPRRARRRRRRRRRRRPVRRRGGDRRERRTPGSEWRRSSAASARAAPSPAVAGVPHVDTVELDDLELLLGRDRERSRRCASLSSCVVDETAPSDGAFAVAERHRALVDGAERAAVWSRRTIWGAEVGERRTECTASGSARRESTGRTNSWSDDGGWVACCVSIFRERRASSQTVDRRTTACSSALLAEEAATPAKSVQLA